MMPESAVPAWFVLALAAAQVALAADPDTVHELPTHEQPAHEQPAHELPKHEQPAHEQPAAPPITVVEPRPERPSEADASPVFSTVIELDDFPQPSATLSDYLALSPGLQVNRLGGPGSYSTLQVRGASAGQLAVFVDGVPISSPAEGEINLEDLPLDALERIEIYRGNSPVAFGADAIAGVLNLVTRAPERPIEARIRLGVGAFGYRRATAGLGIRRGRWVTQLTAGGRSFTGDFPYYFDYGTIYNGGDDEIRLRQNNDTRVMEATARTRYLAESGLELTAQLGALDRDQGLPGPGSSLPTTQSRFHSRRLSGYLRASGPSGRFHWSALADFALKNARLSDPLGELGLPGELADTTLSLGLNARASILISAIQQLDVIALVRDDRYHPDGTGIERARLRLGTGLEYQLRTGPLSVLPAVLYDHFIPSARGALPTDGTGLPVEDVQASDLISPRLGLELRPWRSRPSWRIRANGGRFHRAPSFYELYGVGSVDANPELEPEQGFNADLGGTLEQPLSSGPVRLEAAGFYSRTRNLILFQQNSQNSVRADNIGEAQLGGLELSVDLRWQSLLTLGASYTLLASENLSDTPSQYGKPLAGRPMHSGHALVGFELGWFSSYYRVDAASGTWLDAANEVPVPWRLFQDVGITGKIGQGTLKGLEASLEVRNLFNVFYEEVSYSESPRMVSDFIGYPLPGRAFYLTLSWRR